jgi:hypothetical protein
MLRYTGSGLLLDAQSCAPDPGSRDEFGLRDALGGAHRRYTRLINFRAGWRGHIWHERFHSFVMDERHLLAQRQGT